MYFVFNVGLIKDSDSNARISYNVVYTIVPWHPQGTGSRTAEEYQNPWIKLTTLI